jgi:hypothetical protein
MPTTKHSDAAERHFQPEHAHDVAAASRDKHQGFTSHEEQKFAEEQSREAREHNAQIKKEAEKK